MKTGRNEPCWCGSGKKYKHCHLAADRAAPPVGPDSERQERIGDPRDAAGAAHSSEGAADGLHVVPAPAAPPGPTGGEPMHGWEVDVVPLPITFDDTPDARPAMVLVVDSASGFIVKQDLLAHAPSDPGEIARVMAENVHAGAGITGRWPRSLWVRHSSIADALGAALEDRDIPVLTAAILPGVDDAIQSLFGFMNLPVQAAAPSMVETWAGWGQPRDRIAALFKAAAAFYRTAPWRWITNEQVLEVETARGGSWAMTVMGNGGQEFGLALYEDPEDLLDLCESRGEDPGQHFANLAGGVISLTFDAARDLPRRMQQEIAAARWEIADRRAYPVLMTINTPGGGIEADAFLDVIDLLGTVPRFVAEHKDALTDPLTEVPIEWTDDSNGTQVIYAGPWGMDEEDWLWLPLYNLATALAEGPGARPEAALDLEIGEASLSEAAEAHVAAFRSWLAAGRGRMPRSSKRRTVEAAEFFLVHFLAGYQHVPIEAVTEFDLRVFLYDWFPRKVRQEWSEAEAALAALAKLAEFLATERGIHLPWAAGIFAGEEAEAFRVRFERFPGGFWWDEGVAEWQAELYNNLGDRILLHDPYLGERDQWGETMGMDEARLDRELQRRWLMWRDEVIRAGKTEPGAVFAECRRRQRTWEKQRHPGFGGRTPLQVIKAERRASGPRAKH